MHLRTVLRSRPSARAIAETDPGNPRSESDARELAAAARIMGCQLVVPKAPTEQEIDTAFATMTRQRVRALVVHNDAFLNSRRDQIITLAARNALPAIYGARENAEAGGLVSYAPNFKEMFRQSGIYAGRILKGTKPGDLPVQQPTKIQLVINLKTAKALGLTVPLTLQADGASSSCCLVAWQPRRTRSHRARSSRRCR